MKDCLFCAIANGDKEKLIWESELAAAFADIHPKAPVHVLVVPKQHVEKLDDLSDPTLAAHMIDAVREVAKLTGVKGGWQLQVNVGRAGGQLVDHLHFHVLGHPQKPA